MTIQENVLLAPYTVFKIGGRARYFCEVKSTDELQFQKELAGHSELPPLTVFGKDLNSSESKSSFTFFVSMDYKYLVPYANFDSLGIIALGFDSLDAMIRTDQAMGLFADSQES